MIDRSEIIRLAGELGLRPSVVEKDYVLGWVLAGIARDWLMGSLGRKVEGTVNVHPGKHAPEPSNCTRDSERRCLFGGRLFGLIFGGWMLEMISRNNDVES